MTGHAVEAPTAGPDDVGPRDEPWHRSASEIARQVRSGEATARAIVDSHLARIRSVNADLDAVVADLAESARQQADLVDRRLAAGEEVGPLAGVPITVKESFHVAGTASSGGIVALADDIAADDSPVIERLRSAGAIVLGKTNVAQCLMFHESDNPVYGRANNPWALDRTPGGSSGGEGAIVAAGGVPLGIGTDIGGSMRVPAHFTGVHALKPTTNRMTRRGSLEATTWPGQSRIVSQPSPVARHVADLTLALRVMVVHDPADATVPPVPLRDPDDVDIAGLGVGMFEDDGLFRPSPAIRRAVRESAAALGERGARVMPLEPPDPVEALRLYYGILSAGGAGWLADQLAGTRQDRRVRALTALADMPGPLRAGLAAGADLLGQRLLAATARSVGRTSAVGFWRLNATLDAYRDRLEARMQDAGIDVLLCPPHALPALLHGASLDVGLGGSYAPLFNLLGMPAGVVSVTRIRPGEESDRPRGRDRAITVARRVERRSAGLPVGVQVAARPWREDLVLAAMAAIEAAFSGRPDYPCGRDAPIRAG